MTSSPMASEAEQHIWGTRSRAGGSWETKGRGKEELETSYALHRHGPNGIPPPTGPPLLSLYHFLVMP